MAIVKPEQTAPELEVKICGSGERWKLSRQKPKLGTIIVFYRGGHCAECREYLTKIEAEAAHSREVGIEWLAVSADHEEGAERTCREHRLETLQIAYGLTEHEMRDWGLFISAGMREQEPPLFCEPAVMVVRRDMKLYASWLASAPVFGWPALSALTDGVAGLLERKAPATGQR